ncbi:GGDEF domain-containing protein [Shewanella profunda]|uniref:GGDEF domain-containing protein n=1 Tax=Shewanella profunda TaxID=254793 RepID=UPI00200ECD30|nr:GGDEF domain-containing protein [Shewanella profunda]MCL1091652.1 GGDEF domain-containing protein [Shewanella profunda]
MSVLLVREPLIKEITTSRIIHQALLYENAQLQRALNVALQQIADDQKAFLLLKQEMLLDPLTKTPNRQVFQDRVEQALQHAKRSALQLAVIFIDIDGFKAINDRLGHNAGDLVLTQFTAILKQCLRSSDTVSRYGGDEFVILLPEIGSSDDASAIAVKILKALARPMRIGTTRLTLEVSLGIALYPSDGECVRSLTHSADGAMYQVKNAGGCGFQFVGA